ncbi:MAG: GntR family transcriptional regulator, partial [Rhodobacteraceae bacterium]|nr:GntR family transcriptional regulator [Paracoccaceae bacterium]
AQTAHNIMKSHMQIAEELMKTQEASLTKQFMGD